MPTKNWKPLNGEPPASVMLKLLVVVDDGLQPLDTLVLMRRHPRDVVARAQEHPGSDNTKFDGSAAREESVYEVGPGERRRDSRQTRRALKSCE